MTAPILNKHNLSGQVPLNVRIHLEFDQPLLQITVGAASIVLTPQGSFSLIKAKYSYTESGGHGIVEILPDYLLEASKAYTLTITPKLKSASGEPLASAQTIDFTTAATLSSTPASPEAQQAWNEALSGPQSGFRLVSSNPADGAYDINTNPDQGNLQTRITLSFSENLDPTQWPDDPIDWNQLPVSLMAEAIDGDPRTAAQAPLPESVTVSGKTVTITLKGQTGYAYNTDRNPTAPLATPFDTLTLQPNNLLTLTLSGDLRSSGGQKLGGEQELVFSSELFPKYGTVKSVFWRQGHITQVLDMEGRELDYLIYEESKWLATMMLARDPQARVDLPRQLMLDFVRYKVLWTILSEAVTSQAIGGTTQDKTLGPFRISKSFSTMPPALLRLLSSWEKSWKQALEALLPMAERTGYSQTLVSIQGKLDCDQLAGYLQPILAQFAICPFLPIRNIDVERQLYDKGLLYATSSTESAVAHESIAAAQQEIDAIYREIHDAVDTTRSEMSPERFADFVSGYAGELLRLTKTRQGFTLDDAVSESEANFSVKSGRWDGVLEHGVLLKGDAAHVNPVMEPEGEGYRGMIDADAIGSDQARAQRFKQWAYRLAYAKQGLEDAARDYTQPVDNVRMTEVWVALASFGASPLPSSPTAFAFNMVLQIFNYLPYTTNIGFRGMEGGVSVQVDSPEESAPFNATWPQLLLDNALDQVSRPTASFVLPPCGDGGRTWGASPTRLLLVEHDPNATAAGIPYSPAGVLLGRGLDNVVYTYSGDFVTMPIEGEKYPTLQWLGSGTQQARLSFLTDDTALLENLKDFDNSAALMARRYETLNADQADGYDFNQDVRSSATPQFAGFKLAGTTSLPPTIDATTMLLATGFGSPISSKVYIGDGTGWQYIFANNATAFTVYANNKVQTFKNTLDDGAGALTAVSLKVTGGSPAAGKVLAGTDGLGNAAWATETDPVFGAAPAKGITAPDIALWRGLVNNPVWKTLSDGSLSSQFAKVVIGNLAAGSERLMVQGYSGASTFSANLVTYLSGGNAAVTTANNSTGSASWNYFDNVVSGNGTDWNCYQMVIEPWLFYRWADATPRKVNRVVITTGVSATPMFNGAMTLYGSNDANQIVFIARRTSVVAGDFQSDYLSSDYQLLYSKIVIPSMTRMVLYPGWWKEGTTIVGQNGSVARVGRSVSATKVSDTAFTFAMPEDLRYANGTAGTFTAMGWARSRANDADPAEQTPWILPQSTLPNGSLDQPATAMNLVAALRQSNAWQRYMEMTLSGKCVLELTSINDPTQGTISGITIRHPDGVEATSTSASYRLDSLYWFVQATNVLRCSVPGVSPTGRGRHILLRRGEELRTLSASVKVRLRYTMDTPAAGEDAEDFRIRSGFIFHSTPQGYCEAGVEVFLQENEPDYTWSGGKWVATGTRSRQKKIRAYLVVTDPHVRLQTSGQVYTEGDARVLYGFAMAAKDWSPDSGTVAMTSIGGTPDEVTLALTVRDLGEDQFVGMTISRAGKKVSSTASCRMIGSKAGSFGLIAQPCAPELDANGNNNPEIQSSDFTGLLVTAPTGRFGAAYARGIARRLDIRTAKNCFAAIGQQRRGRGAEPQGAARRSALQHPRDPPAG